MRIMCNEKKKPLATLVNTRKVNGLTELEAKALVGRPAYNHPIKGYLTKCQTFPL